MAVSWNGSFESDPAGGASPSLGDDVIRSFKGAIRERIEKEHVMTTGTGNYVDHGWHRLGAGRAYFTQGVPVYLPDLATTLASRPADARGRLWIHSTTFLQKVHTGTAWVRTQRELTRISIQGTLAAGTDVVPRIIFPRTVTLLKIIARSKTKPTTSSIILNLKKNGSVSIFTNRISIPITTFVGFSTIGNMVTASIMPISFLQLDVDSAGGTTGTKGSDIALVLEAMV